MERTKNVHKIHPSKKKQGSRGEGRAFVTLIQQLYLKTIRVYVIIYRFLLLDKATRKKKKNLNNPRKESQSVEPRKKEGVN